MLRYCVVFAHVWYSLCVIHHAGDSCLFIFGLLYEWYTCRDRHTTLVAICLFFCVYIYLYCLFFSRHWLCTKATYYVSSHRHNKLTWQKLFINCNRRGLISVNNGDIGILISLWRSCKHFLNCFVNQLREAYLLCSLTMFCKIIINILLSNVFEKNF